MNPNGEGPVQIVLIVAWTGIALELDIFLLMLERFHRLLKFWITWPSWSNGLGRVAVRSYGFLEFTL
jgi:hypothetical protein